MYCIFERKKKPTPTQRWFPFSKHFSCYNGENMSPQVVFQLNSYKNNFAEATLVKAVMYKELYACFDVTDHYFEKPSIGYNHRLSPYRASVSSPLHN